MSWLVTMRERDAVSPGCTVGFTDPTSHPPGYEPTPREPCMSRPIPFGADLGTGVCVKHPAHCNHFARCRTVIKNGRLSAARMVGNVDGIHAPRATSLEKARDPLFLRVALWSAPGA